MNLKKIVKSLGVLALVFVIGYAINYTYNIHFNYNFGAITEGKVYKSGVIPPSKIAGYLKDNHIKTVIDFRDGSFQDKLNPAYEDEIDAERQAVIKVDGVTYYNFPSLQVPTQANLDSLYAVLDVKANYPVLMHCHHGTGRAMVYSSVYRMEYEDMDNTEARKMTRPFFSLPFSSFGIGKDKGDFIENYKKRDTK